MNCRTCGGPLVQKNRLLLLVIGVALLVPIIVLPRSSWIAPATFFLALVGCYFLVWSIVAGGRWCRNCKRLMSGQ